MKIGIVLVSLLGVGAAFAQGHSAQKATDQSDVGRYQIVQVRLDTHVGTATETVNTAIKIDTVTGKTWGFVQNQNYDGRSATLQYGWDEIPNSAPSISVPLTK